MKNIQIIKEEKERGRKKRKIFGFSFSIYKIYINEKQVCLLGDKRTMAFCMDEWKINDIFLQNLNFNGRMKIMVPGYYGNPNWYEKERHLFENVKIAGKAKKKPSLLSAGPGRV